MELDLPQVGETWRHFKGGKYTVTGFTYAAEGDKLELRVLYASGSGLVFSRPLMNFIGPTIQGGPVRFVRNEC